MGRNILTMVFGTVAGVIGLVLLQAMVHFLSTIEFINTPITIIGGVVFGCFVTFKPWRQP